MSNKELNIIIKNQDALMSGLKEIGHAINIQNKNVMVLEQKINHIHQRVEEIVVPKIIV